MHLPKRDIFITVRLEWKHKSLSIMQSKINKGCSLGSINRRYTEHILRLTLHQTAISLPLIQKQHYRYVCSASDFKQQFKTSLMLVSSYLYHAEGARSDFHSGNGNLVCSVLLWWTIDHVSVLCGIWKSNLSHIELDKMNRVPIACLHYQIMINFYEGSLAFIIISIHGLSGQDSTIFHPMKVYTVVLYARSLQLATTTVYIQCTICT